MTHDSSGSAGGPAGGGMSRWLGRGVVIAAVVLGVGYVGWKAGGDPEVAFLTPRAGAEWIIYPKVREQGSRSPVVWDCVFWRAFELDAAPDDGAIVLRAFRGAAVSINGQAADEVGAGGDNWRAERRYEVGGLLERGVNRVAVTVENESGPPALWLRLVAAGDVVLGSDATWRASLMGAADRPAHLAAQPLPAGAGETSGIEMSAWRAVGRDWLTWLVMAAAAGVMVMGVGWGLRRLSAGGEVRVATAARWGPRVLLMLIGAAWVVLVVHNVGLLAVDTGFDIGGHLQYVQHILDEGSLPLADEGWEMFQPPFYYLLSAAGLAMTGQDANDPGAAWVYRTIGLAAGLSIVVMVWLAVRMMIPDGPGRPPEIQETTSGMGRRGGVGARVVGVLMAAGMPMQIYLAQYATNELLAAALSIGGMVLALRIVRSGRESIGVHAALGAVLGLAMLTKFSALLVTAGVIVVLGGAMLARGQRRAMVWGRTLGVLAMVWIAVCGWHYMRVYDRFDTFLVGNWDAAAGYEWWQDPGYRTVSDYLRMGGALERPLFGAHDGLLNGVYATAWGDGLIGGSDDGRFAPAWNYSMMSGGYVWALVVTGLVSVGAIAAGVRLLRRPRATWMLLLGVAGVSLLALVLMTMRMPYYGLCKAILVAPLVLPMCVLGAWGYGVLSRRRWLGTVLLVLVVTWAMGGYAAFWIRGDGAQARFMSATQKPSEAAAILERLIADEPAHGAARAFLIDLYTRAGQAAKARSLIDASLAATGDDFDVRMAAARWGRAERDGAMMLAHAQAAVGLSANAHRAHQMVGQAQQVSGRWAEAAGAYREVLRIRPGDVNAHRQLAMLYGRMGMAEASARHGVYADRLSATSGEVPKQGH